MPVSGSSARAEGEAVRRWGSLETERKYVFVRVWEGGKRKKEGCWTKRAYHVSGSWLMSVRLVSLRMARIRSKESAWRILSNWTCGISKNLSKRLKGDPKLN